jgi:hypothetical protein
MTLVGPEYERRTERLKDSENGRNARVEGPVSATPSVGIAGSLISANRGKTDGPVFQKLPAEAELRRAVLSSLWKPYAISVVFGGSRITSGAKSNNKIVDVN